MAQGGRVPERAAASSLENKEGFSLELGGEGNKNSKKLEWKNKNRKQLMSGRLELPNQR